MKEAIEILVDKLVSTTAEQWKHGIKQQEIVIGELQKQIDSLRGSLNHASTLLERANVELANYRKKERESDKPLTNFYYAACAVTDSRTSSQRKKTIDELKVALKAAEPFIDIIPF